jgi:hypothetical protein
MEVGPPVVPDPFIHILDKYARAVVLACFSKIIFNDFPIKLCELGFRENTKILKQY